jgi:hypothetical protein
MTWDQFKGVFKAALEAQPPESLLQAWENSSNRTGFYKGLFRDYIAKEAGLEYSSELFLVDHLLRTGDPNWMPQVWIESENSVLSAQHEIYKLCCLQGPLKVLITVAAWDETQHWRGVGLQGFPESWVIPEDHLKKWHSIVKAFSDSYNFSGQLGVIIGERSPNGRLRYYAHEIRPDGVDPLLGNIIFAHEQPFR